MWVDIEHSTLEPGMYCDRTIEYRIEKDLVICCIKKVRRRANTLKISWIDLYRARVYYRVMFDQDHLQHKRIDIIYDEDLDVLKLKCLIKAKEMGWNIKCLS